jgi:hypothetical protein
MIESMLHYLNSSLSFIIEFEHELSSQYKYKLKQSLPLTLNRTMTCLNTLNMNIL